MKAGIGKSQLSKYENGKELPKLDSLAPQSLRAVSLRVRGCGRGAGSRSDHRGAQILMEALRLVDFVTVAIKRYGRWMLVLDFWPTDDEEADWSSLSWTLPWLPELREDRGRVCEELRRHGLALVVCADEEEARRLLNQIQGFRVGAKVFTDRGEETNCCLPGNRSVEKSAEKRKRRRSPRPKKVTFRLVHGHRMGPGQNTEICLRGEAKETVSMQNIVRRLYRRVKKIEALYQEVDKLHELIPVPTPEEFEEMVSGKRPLTLEVLLIGVLGKSLFHLSEANVVIDYFRPYTSKSLGKGTHARWRAELAERIRREVKWRAQGPPAPLDGEDESLEKSILLLEARDSRTRYAYNPSN